MNNPNPDTEMRLRVQVIDTHRKFSKTKATSWVTKFFSKLSSATSFSDISVFSLSRLRNKAFTKVVTVLLVILTTNAHADVAGCGSHIALSIQASEKTDTEVPKQKITTKTTQIKITKKTKGKSSHLGKFKFLLPDTSKNN